MAGKCSDKTVASSRSVDDIDGAARNGNLTLTENREETVAPEGDYDDLIVMDSGFPSEPSYLPSFWIFVESLIRKERKLGLVDNEYIYKLQEFVRELFCWRRIQDRCGLSFLTVAKESLNSSIGDLELADEEIALVDFYTRHIIRQEVVISTRNDNNCIIGIGHRDQSRASRCDFRPEDMSQINILVPKKMIKLLSEGVCPKLTEKAGIGSEPRGSNSLVRPLATRKIIQSVSTNGLSDSWMTIGGHDDIHVDTAGDDNLIHVFRSPFELGVVGKWLGSGSTGIADKGTTDRCAGD